ncbi:MAG: S-layer homology domain-containing protein [Oscillospiraceae bacterium]|jgi:hypothetical protein|nr:S-layer homology domain-containing protein [Oscillospiraceae bacterium]
MKKKMTAAILALALCVGLSVPAVAAETEQPSLWAVEHVNAAIAANLVPLSLQSRYTQVITRAEFCALVVALYENVKGEITGRIAFTDTNDINAEKTAHIGVVFGVGDNRFAPDDTLTREQAATMLSRLAETMGMQLYGWIPSFDDNSSVSAWAVHGVGQMQFAGIMVGTGDNTFSPKGNYTREQSILTIMRLFDAFHLGSVSIEYDANGGSGVPPGHEVLIAPSIGGDEYGVIWQQIVFVIPNEIPTRSGYTFQGWTSDYYPDLDIHKAGDLFDAIGIHVADGFTISLSAVWDAILEIDLHNQGITNERLSENA